MEMDPGLKELVCESIAAFCRVPADSIGRLTVERIYAADRQIYRLTPATGSRSFALKMRSARGQKQSDSSGQATEEEYSRIQGAWSALKKGGGTLGMPMPIALYPDHRAILTTWCHGQELRKVYYAKAWRWLFSAGHLRACFRLSGEWLGRFHSASRYSVNTADILENRLNHIDRMLTWLPEAPRNSLSVVQLAGLKDAILRALTASDRIDFGLLHGNFTLRNILVSPGGASPVDFEDSREEAICLDSGQLVADVILSAYRPFIHPPVRRGVVAAFLKEYDHYVPLDIDRVKGFAIYHVLATYYEVVGRPVNGVRDSLMASRQARTFAELLRRPQKMLDTHL